MAVESFLTLDSLLTLKLYRNHALLFKRLFPKTIVRRKGLLNLVFPEYVPANEQLIAFFINFDSQNSMI